MSQVRVLPGARFYDSDGQNEGSDFGKGGRELNDNMRLRAISGDELGLLLEAFYDDCEVARLSKQTIDRYYKVYLPKFHWWIHETERPLDPARHTPDDIRAYLRYIQGSPNRWNSEYWTAQKKITPGGLDAYYRTLRRFYNWLVEQEYIDRSPMDKVRKPRLRQMEVKPFMPDELERISRALRNREESEIANRDRAIMAVLLDVGLRASELCALTINDVDIQTGTIDIRHGKGDKARTVQLGASGRRSIRRYWLRYRSQTAESMHDPFFVSLHAKALHPNGLLQMFRRLGERARVENCHPHKARHTAAISALRAGMGLLELQSMLGHASLEMTRHYARIAETDIARAAREHSALDSLKLNL